MQAIEAHPSDSILMRRSPGLWVLRLVIALGTGFVCFGALFLPGRLHNFQLAIGLVVCGYHALYSVLMLLPGSAYLRLTPQGFAVCRLWRTRFTAWSDVSRFTVRSVKRTWTNQDQVRFDRRAPIGMLAPYGWRNTKLKELYQCDEANKLASLMNEWRDRALGAAVAQGSTLPRP